ncbi:MAG: excinuclease ABC subunit UvrA [Planctomycetaceae bacterium]
MNTPTIRIRGARTHNLRNLDVDIPVGQITVVTGLSGSGKSSLTHDTMFAEGQRQFLECASVQTHQMLRSLRRPDVDEVSGLPPTISVDQRVHLVPSRSTVAVTTEIHNYLRLLYARCGVVHCTTCDRPVQCRTIDEIVQQVLRFPDRSRFMVLAPLVRKRRGNHKEVLSRIRRHGLVRVRVDGALVDLSDVPELEETKQHSIDAVIDRLILKDGVESRLHESVSLAVRESGDACLVCMQSAGNWQDHYFNTRHSCPACEISFEEPDPGLFSFNSGRGACPVCEGLGVQGVVDDADDITVFRKQPCAKCNGSRLQLLPARVRFGHLTLPALTALSVVDTLSVVQQWQQSLLNSDLPLPDEFAIRPEGRAAALRILPDIARRLISLSRVGLDYLTLNRATRSLSGGEYQRARLAGCLGTDLYGACYLFDEPTSGLHPQDTQLLLTLLLELRQAGSTLVLVEHDPDVMRAADHLIDIGPGAGTDGGELLYAGPPSAIPADTPTGLVLTRHSLRASTGTEATAPPPTHQLKVQGAQLHNLKDITVAIPLNRFVCVTGVSGSGKSSLINGTLVPVVQASCTPNVPVDTTLADVECRAIEGLGHIDRVVSVDGRAVSRNRRSCLATHSGVWQDIRKLYARTREARAQGFAAGQFSFNSGRGRCPECKGTGVQEIRMSFLPDAEVPCAVCGGRRFRSDILSVRFSGRTAHDVLNLRVDEALAAFSEFDSISRRLRPFQQVGLGYMTLGQPASTFSGGEAQRIRLATELIEPVDSRSLYILDEPTRGLHGADVDRLLNVLRGLIDRGHSMIVIEHNTQVICAADWIIDLGPGPAESGGHIVAEGSVNSLRDHPTSVTGRWI